MAGSRSVSRGRRLASGPTLSLIVCTRDRPDALLSALESVWAQSRLPDELIVIDDGALPESLRGRIAVDARRADVPFVFQRATGRGLTAARNQGARAATCGMLVYVDDDVTCDPDFLAHIDGLLRDPAVGGVTAMVDEPAFESRSARLFQWGYRLAGWWRIGPRGRPATPPPSVLMRPDVATRARWLNGAAMAFRRAIILEHPFDESLTEYALGEDREMGYRLAPRYWLLQSKLARVVHHRLPGIRADGRRHGYMTTLNYLHVLRRTCAIGIAETMQIAWSFCVIAMMHLVWAIGPWRREHLRTIHGMIRGLLVAARAARETRGRVGTDKGVFARIRSGGNAPRIAGAPVTTRRVLFVTNSLDSGGAERMLVALATRLPQAGVHPAIVCLKDAGPLAVKCRAANIPVFENLLRHRTDVCVIRRMTRLIRKQNFDLIVVAQSGGDRMFWTTLAGRLAGIPVVVWSHWFPMPGRRHIERLNRALYRFVDRFVALGPRHRRALIRHEFVPAGRIHVLPNAVDVRRLSHISSRAAARRRLNLEDRHFAVAIIANLRPEKRHDIFIEAARRLASAHPNFRFLIIGDGPHRQSVRRHASDSGLDPDVLRFVGPRDDVPDLLAGIDVSVLCSEVECFSVTMLEAAAAGVAFVGPAVGELPEYLRHEETGLQIRPGHAVDLAAAIERLADDSDLRDRCISAARRRVTRDYDIHAMVRRFAELFESTLSAKSVS